MKAKNRKIAYDNTYGMVDMSVYGAMMAQDNRAQLGRLKRNLTQALRQDITPRQREYMMLYYGKCMSMEQIAKELGVNKSTVCRTLARGRRRLYRCLRYGAANLLEQAES